MASSWSSRRTSPDPALRRRAPRASARGASSIRVRGRMLATWRARASGEGRRQGADRRELDMPAGVRAVRPEAPALGQVHHLREQRQDPVRGARRLAHVVVELHDVGPRDLGDGERGERGPEIEAQVAAVRGRGARLLLRGRALIQVTVGELAEGDRAPRSRGSASRCSAPRPASGRRDGSASCAPSGATRCGTARRRRAPESFTRRPKPGGAESHRKTSRTGSGRALSTDRLVSLGMDDFVACAG